METMGDNIFVLHIMQNSVSISIPWNLDFLQN